MLQSIVDDIKGQFRHGNMVTKIILVNTAVLLIMVFLKAFSPPSSEFYPTIRSFLVMHSDTFKWLTRPWTFITHMFLHEGFWHYAWNMIILYWFARIVGDLIGDRKILPLYLIGGLAGAFFYILWVQISGMTGFALGASGAVMCMVVAAAFIAPEYEMRLLLIGNVRLKYVALGLVVIDILTNSASNPGGTMAHLGGAIMGGLYVHFLQRGNDLTEPLQRLFDSIGKSTQRERRAPMKVVHNKKKPARTYTESTSHRSDDVQSQIDDILDKINQSGYDSLTTEEKDFLYRASKD